MTLSQMFMVSIKTSLLAVHTYHHLLLARITQRGTYPVIKSKRRLSDPMVTVAGGIANYGIMVIEVYLILKLII
jgi:hypothetical protein